MSARIMNMVLTIPQAGLLLLAAEFFLSGEKTLAVNTLIEVASNALHDVCTKKNNRPEISSSAYQC